MEIISSPEEVRKQVRRWREQGLSVGLVPTMGALHAGHKSLVDRSVAENDFTVVSVFVNPTQFNNQEDLVKYPRTEDADVAMLEEAGVDVAFIPTAQEVYGDEPDTRVFDLGPVAEVMEGAMRPGHFNGVAQIVSRLFLWTMPDKAYFGEKDFQQIAVIRRMADIEGFDSIEIVACPIVREADGLALSSRNVRLTPEMRKAAPAIHRVLDDSKQMKVSGKSVADVIEAVTKSINAVEGLEVEYYSIVDPISMQPVSSWDETSHPVGCITVYAGDVRLIDNIAY